MQLMIWQSATARMTAASSEAIELEALLAKANPDEHADFLKFLLGETDQVDSGSTAASKTDKNPSRLRLYDDKKFLLEGYRYLTELNSSYSSIEETGNLMMLTAPPDLRRRLGQSDKRNDVIFGSTAVPEESWPANHHFRLTDDSDQV